MPPPSWIAEIDRPVPTRFELGQPRALSARAVCVLVLQGNREGQLTTVSGFFCKEHKAGVRCEREGCEFTAVVRPTPLATRSCPLTARRTPRQPHMAT